MSYYWLAEVAEASGFYRSQKEEMVERGHRAFALAIAALATAGDKNIDWKRLGTIAQEKGLEAEKAWSVLQESGWPVCGKYYALREIILEKQAVTDFYKNNREIDFGKFQIIFKGIFERFSSNMGEIFDVPPEVHQSHIEEIRLLLIKFHKLPAPIPIQNS